MERGEGVVGWTASVGSELRGAALADAGEGGVRELRGAIGTSARWVRAPWCRIKKQRQRSKRTIWVWAASYRSSWDLKLGDSKDARELKRDFGLSLLMAQRVHVGVFK